MLIMYPIISRYEIFPFRYHYYSSPIMNQKKKQWTWQPSVNETINNERQPLTINPYDISHYIPIWCHPPLMKLAIEHGRFSSMIFPAIDLRLVPGFWQQSVAKSPRCSRHVGRCVCAGQGSFFSRIILQSFWALGSLAPYSLYLPVSSNVAAQCPN